MKTYTSSLLQTHFIGRKAEQETLKKIASRDEASILVVHGRRRVGKTELIERTFQDRNLLKFEGIEGKSQEDQRKNVLDQLAQYTGDSLFSKLETKTWKEVFELIGRFILKGKWTLYFEEVQWLASYKNDFISELKYVWDNLYRRNPHLLLILCGSSPSFMLGSVLKSKALYNRSQYELPLKEFNLMEAKDFLGPKRSLREVMDAYLTVGGIPEYLKRVKEESSIYLGLCKNSFTQGGFFSKELDRIFVSQLGNSKDYRAIVEYLSKVRFATREEIANFLKITSGGTLTNMLTDLEVCQFINKYTPFYLDEESLLSRYHIRDSYLQFYYKFIKPLKKDIEHGDYEKNPVHALKTDTYNKWLGFSFERWCRSHHRLLARILNFEAVHYRHGAFFSRNAAQRDKGYQIDLVYDRDDKIYTICEIKYLQKPATKEVIRDMEKKLDLFPNTKNRTLHKILISPEGADSSVIKAGYFDKIMTLNEIFDSHYWV